MVVGGGHNGLVCAAYLAAGGLDVEVVEANDAPGGCIWTERLESGHRLERGAVDLTMIDDIVADLRLADHGLHLLSRDVLLGAAYGDGAQLVFRSDLDSTVAGWSGVDEADCDAYRSFAGLAARALSAFDSLPGVPTFDEISRLAGSFPGGGDLTRLLVSSAESVIGRRIRHEGLAGAIAMYAAHGQLPPWLPGTGLFSLLLPGSHGTTTYRPSGGTAALVDAIGASLEASGGVDPDQRPRLDHRLLRRRPRRPPRRR